MLPASGKRVGLLLIYTVVTPEFFCGAIEGEMLWGNAKKIAEMVDLGSFFLGEVGVGEVGGGEAEPLTGRKMSLMPPLVPPIALHN